ncbi:MAG: NAD-dependent epimerase/dehydratase family protein, partial [Alphaproteobacteria bacterium]|nr:NAD-dependent epimerase/dehydratase family protein [Alphaproteobacteria bacterium]
MGDKVLVTGASGFVGSAVARALSRRGDDVRVLMRSTSPRTNIEGETFE